MLADLLMFAQTTPTRAPDPVEIVNLKDGGGAWWHVPALTGAASFFGVLVAGWIQHKIEAKRQTRALDAEKRRAIGALRLGRRYFAGVIHHTGAAAQEMDCSLLRGMEPPLRSEEEHLLATWVTDEEWRLYTIPIGKMRVLHQLLGCYDPESAERSEPCDTDLKHMRELWESARDAVTAFQGAQDRLAAAVGDPVVQAWPALTGTFPDLDASTAAVTGVPEEPEAS